MIVVVRQSTTRRMYLLFVAFVFLSAFGCAGPKVAADLLNQVSPVDEPLVANSVTVEAAIDPRINNYERIDETLKQSLEIALAKSNIFGTSSTRSYRITGYISVASQSAWSFGNFNGRLEVKYVVLDGAGKEILATTIYTVAGSDEWSFVGAKRHRRARAVNISKNVLEFVDILVAKLKVN